MKRILVVRNDRLGDFLLAWPALATLRLSLEQVRIGVLVPSYTAELAQMCPWVDEVFTDPGPGSGLIAAVRLAREIRRGDFGSAITLFSTGRVAAILTAAGIRDRWAPATKAAQVLYPHRVVQRRSRSEKPEYAYNEDLVRAFLEHHAAAAVASPRPLLVFDEEDTRSRRAAFCAGEGWAPSRPIVWLHPGTGGSGPSLSPGRFVDLAMRISAHEPPGFVVSAGPGEFALAEKVRGGLSARGLDVALLHSIAGLTEFARQVAWADVVVAASTGPLHLAGVLDVRTVGFYPRGNASALRWRTTNSEGRWLALEPPADAGGQALDAIDLGPAARRISRWLGGRDVP